MEDSRKRFHGLIGQFFPSRGLLVILLESCCQWSLAMVPAIPGANRADRLARGIGSQRPFRFTIETIDYSFFYLPAKLYSPSFLASPHNAFLQKPTDRLTLSHTLFIPTAMNHGIDKGGLVTFCPTWGAVCIRLSLS
jgi:hypothetical protein